MHYSWGTGGVDEFLSEAGLVIGLSSFWTVRSRLEMGSIGLAVPIQSQASEKSLWMSATIGFGIGTPSSHHHHRKGVYEARARDRVFFVGTGAVAASCATLDFEERVLRRRPGFASDFGSTLAAAAGVAMRDGPAPVLRPRPLCFALAEQCSVYPGAVRG